MLSLGKKQEVLGGEGLQQARGGSGGDTVI